MDLLRRLNKILDARLPRAVKTIFLANIAVFLAYKLLATLMPEPRVTEFVARYLAENPLYSLRSLMVYQFGTYMFIHLELGHLAFNLLYLWFFAPELELRWGRPRFWRFYLLSGAGAGLLHTIVAMTSGNSPAPVVGASGALFGVLLAYGAYYPNRIVFVFGLIPILSGWLVAAIMFFDMTIQGPSRENVSAVTHFGGLAAAFLYLTRYHRTSDITKWRYLG